MKKNRELRKKAVALVLVGTMLVENVLSVQATTLADVFDANYYADTYADLKAAFGNDERALYEHYKTYGTNEGRQISEILDVVKYRKENPDLDEAFGDNWDAYINHYFTYGFKEGRESYGVFDANEYLDSHAGLREAFGDDILAIYQHYVANDGVVSVTLVDLFDAEYYADTYADLRVKFGNDEGALLEHYKTYGINEGRKGNAIIDVVQYRAKNPDLEVAFGDDWDLYLDHYIKRGCKEGRESFGSFDALAYADRYEDLKEAFGSDIISLYRHYVNYGREEGRNAKPTSGIYSHDWDWDEVVEDTEDEVVEDTEDEVVEDTEDEVVEDTEDEIVEDTEDEVVEDLCKVTFDTDGGSEIKSQVIKKGELVLMPTAPIKDNYMFIGWFEEENVNDWKSTFSFDTPIQKDLVLRAVWVDVTTDTDKDGLFNDIEDYIGSNSNMKDSDMDGLDDYKEVIIFDYSPIIEDTDDDGVKDSDEDYDEDGLVNKWELDNGIDPILQDTDNDNLNDYEEVSIYKTNPINIDTDGDKATDGDEVRLDTDPLVANSEFVEKISFGDLTENLQVTVDVKATIDGEQVGTMEVTPVTYGNNPIISPTIPGYLGHAYDISVNGQPKSAELIFKYDTSLGTLSEDFQPRIYYYNEEIKTFEELPNQEVHEGQVSVTIEHFSTYILLNKTEFDEIWKNEIKPPETDIKNEDVVIDIAFVIDYSLSMEENDPNQLYKKVSKEFISKLRDGIDRATVIEFIKVAAVLSPLTTDKVALENAIDSIVYDDGWGYNSGTDGSEGIYLALEQLIPSESKFKYIVFITDGEDNDYTYSYDDLITSAVSSNVNIYTIGMGNASEEILSKVADGTGGKYYHATTSADADDVLNLDDVFEEIESETIDYTIDSNKDGISDYYTELIRTGELPLSNGSIELMGIDFNYNENGEVSDDYDMDGVKNGDELKIMTNASQVYMHMVSHPMMEHSDADGYSDFIEHKNGTNPMVYTYTGNSVDYPWNDENFTYVAVYNEEDECWNEAARQIWSSITFNWDHQDEAKQVLATFFDEYSDLDEIQNVSNNIMLEIATLLGKEIMSRAIEKYKLGTLAVDDCKAICEAVTKWQKAGNSARKVSSNHIAQLKEQFSLFTKEYQISFKSFKGISKLDKIGMGVSFALEETIDIYNWIKAYSAITATQAAFYESQDILERIKANDNAREKFVSKAANDILSVINEEYGNFKVEQAKDLALATTENVASLAVGILSGMNPYILAVNLVVGLLDLTSMTEIAEAAYCLYVVDELTNATKELFKYESKTSDYYDILNTNTRHIELLICARMLGGKYAKDVTSEQHYMGFFNDDKIRQEYAQAIDDENAMLKKCLNTFIN